MAKKKNKKNKPTLTAASADRHDLYLKSVQEPSFEVEFFDRVYGDHVGGKPKLLREDFCGTAAVCCEWVKAGDERTAVGVDLDPDPIEWGKANLMNKLSDAQRERIIFLEDDVRNLNGHKADVVAAQNFSFYCFHDRKVLLEYFQAAHANLTDKGVFVLDMMGGSECFQDESVETTNKAGFKYVWELDHFDPITHRCLYHIHFKFKDGTKLPNAFTYDWRLWTLPEVRELLLEAGFSEAVVYWEGADEDGEGNGEFEPAEHGDADPSWICYVVGVK